MSLAHRRLVHLLFALTLIGSGLLTAARFARESPTVDEPTHLARGLTLWWTGDTRMSYAHPPLANAVAALPGAIRDAHRHPRIEELPGWREANPGRTTIALAKADYEQLRSAWVLGRWAVLAASAAFLVYLYRWVGRHIDPLAALLGVGLLAVTPTFLAHAALVTTDGAMIAMFTVCACELVDLLGTRSPWRALRFGLALGVALLVKFSAAVLVPMAVATLAAAALLGQGDRWRDGHLRRRALGLARDVVAVGAVACLTVNAGYGFQRTGWTVERILAAPEPQNNISNDYQDDLLERETPLASLPRGLVVPLPYAYVFGISTIKVQTTGGHPLRSYFLGELRQGGATLYFPVLLFLKVPVVVWIALVPGIVVAVRRRHHALLVPAAMALLFLASVMTSGLNIGVRHALPALPPLVLVAGLGIAAVLRAPLARRPWLAAPLVAAGLLQVASVEHSLLGDFNALARDHARRRHVSVVGEDWGQDVAALGRLVRDRGMTPLHFDGIGHTGVRELHRLGVRPQKHGCKRPGGAGWVAIHDARWVRQRRCYAWLPEEPDLWVGDHIRVYALEVPRAAQPTASR